LAFLRGLPCGNEAGMRTHLHPASTGLPLGSSKLRAAGDRLEVRNAAQDRQVPRAALPASRVTRRPQRVQLAVRRRYPSFLARTGSCVRPAPSLGLAL
jgi:hypothetical protein